MNITRNKPIVGVLGGMGPAATVDFMQRVYRLTPAEHDQDHVHMLIDSNPAVPDRTAGLLGGGPSPLPVLEQMARGLEQAGADFLVMPCNTAHAYHPQLTGAVRIPFLNMITLTAEAVAERFSSGEPVAVLATTGTLRTGLYQQALHEHGKRDPMSPDADEQRAVQAAINQVKAGRVQEGVALLAPVIRALRARGACAFLLGCTEIPLITDSGFPRLPTVNATECLAAATVRKARAR